MLSVFMLSAFMMSVFMLSVFMLSVIVLNVMAPGLLFVLTWLNIDFNSWLIEPNGLESARRYRRYIENFVQYYKTFLTLNLHF